MKFINPCSEVGVRQEEGKVLESARSQAAGEQKQSCLPADSGNGTFLISSLRCLSSQKGRVEYDKPVS